MPGINAQLFLVGGQCMTLHQAEVLSENFIEAFDARKSFDENLEDWVVLAVSQGLLTEDDYPVFMRMLVRVHASTATRRLLGLGEEGSVHNLDRLLLMFPDEFRAIVSSYRRTAALK